MLPAEIIAMLIWPLTHLPHTSFTSKLQPAAVLPLFHPCKVFYLGKSNQNAVQEGESFALLIQLVERLMEQKLITV